MCSVPYPEFGACGDSGSSPLSNLGRHQAGPESTQCGANAFVTTPGLKRSALILAMLQEGAIPAEFESWRGTHIMDSDVSIPSPAPVFDR